MPACSPISPAPPSSCNASTGLTPQQYSLAFALNSAGFVVRGHLGGRLTHRWSARSLLGVGLALNLVARSGCSPQQSSTCPSALIGSLLVMVGAVGLITPPATGLALADHAGAASALLGLSRYLASAAAAPLVGLGGGGTAVPLGIVIMTASCAAAALFLALVLPQIRIRRAQPSKL